MILYVKINSLGGLFGLVSIMIVVLMSLERFFVIKNSLNSLKMSNKMVKCKYNLINMLQRQKLLKFVF